MSNINHVISKSILFLVLATCFFNCSKSGKATHLTAISKISRGTGWGVSPTSFIKPVPGPGLIFIEGGVFVMGGIQDDVMKDWNNISTQLHVQSFYLDETEVTNLMYKEYLDWTKKVFPPSNREYKHVYSGACPDTLVWRNRVGALESLVENYLRYPAYAEYPVVGVSWIQAVEFCKWRTNRANELILERRKLLKQDARHTAVSPETTFDTETYFATPTSLFGKDNEDIILKDRRQSNQNKKERKSREIPQDSMLARETKKGETGVYAERYSGLLLPEYRLPTEAEWEYAAAADVGQRVYNLYKGQRKYPWDGKYTRPMEKKKPARQLANFKPFNGDYGGIAGWSDDGAVITNKVKSYPPNDFGLYDMAGNVSEWVADVYRPTIDYEYSDFNYLRGNVYYKNLIDKDGNFVTVTKETMDYDTLSNGRIVARSFPGQIKQVLLGEEDTFLRINFDKNYEVNFRDGDLQSSKYYKLNNESLKENPQATQRRMYNSPQNNIKPDTLGELIRIADKSNKRTTLISDKMRVYKGGSWRDRSYWLDPSQRRYFPQDVSSDCIGFRSAMYSVGLKAVRVNVAKGQKKK